MLALLTFALALATPQGNPARSADSRPAVTYQPSPEYTEDARAAKISGTVMIALVVDKQGNPTKVHVLRGLGHGLDEKALEAVRAYKFRPAEHDGEPVEAPINIEVNFQIF